MRRAQRIVGLLVALGVIGFGGARVLDYLRWHGAGLVGRWLDPIGPTRDVVWEAGPDRPALPPAERPPNIVVILVDDLGYNDLTWRGGGVAGGAVPTPHIDSIAREGFELTMGYAANATCAPSRAAILTGRYPTRFGFEFTPAPKLFMRMVAGFGRDRPDRLRHALYFQERERDVPPLDEQGLPPGEITLAELLRAHGYRTLGLGKWHLGAAPRLRPEDQGFDEFLGFRQGAALFLPPDDPNAVNAMQDFDPIDRFLWANLPFAVRFNGGPRFTPPGYLTDYLSDEAVKAIEANRHRPFFLYLAYNAPHTPLQALRSDYEALAGIGDPTLRVYGGMIRSLDRGVGRVLEALRRHGLEENTLVVFTSDNGGAHYVGLPDINQPYRGWKMTFFEGGIHAPFFVRWPARLRAGGSFDAPVGHIDVFATAAAAARAPLPVDRNIDGVDLVPFLRGEARGRPHEALFWRSGHYQSVLAGDWKMQISERPVRTWLFDLARDPTERVNRVDSHPDKYRELMSALAAHNAQTVEPAWPSLVEGPIPVDHPLDVPDRPDDEYVYWPN